MKEYKLGLPPGAVAGLHLSAGPLALLGSILLLGVLAGVAIGTLNLSILEGLSGGLLAVCLHWASVIAHHLGHAWAARRTGSPMAGIRLGKLGVLATSLYPLDEPALPATAHIRRALGGPLASLLFSLVATAAAIVAWNVNAMLGWVGVFFFLDNFFVFTLGAFLPLGFTDGTTLLYWWRQRR